MKDSIKYKIAIIILFIAVVVEGVFLATAFKQKKIKKALPMVKGEIAIVLDDWGYNLNNLAIAKEIKYPLTMSVLPRLNYSAYLAEELHKAGFQIILHLPMEPKEKIHLEKDTITNSMDGVQIESIVSRDLDSIPFVRGASNHMGSSATKNTKTMESVFKELLRRKLYFLDSLVTYESICANLAKKMHLRFAKRDVFLDNIEKPEYVMTQIFKLKSRAMLYGHAIGIGHDRKVTLEVLKEVMPRIEQEGFKFVFVSDLVK